MAEPMNIVAAELPVGTTVKLNHPPGTPLRWTITQELTNNHYEITLIPGSVPNNNAVRPGILNKRLVRPDEIYVVPQGGRRKRRHTKHRNTKRRRTLRAR